MLSERDTLDIRYKHYEVISWLDILPFKLKGDWEEMATVLSRVLQTGGKLMLEVSDRSVRSLRSQSHGTPLLNARLSSVQ